MESEARASLALAASLRQVLEGLMASKVAGANDCDALSGEGGGSEYRASAPTCPVGPCIYISAPARHEPDLWRHPEGRRTACCKPKEAHTGVRPRERRTDPRASCNCCLRRAAFFTHFYSPLPFLNPCSARPPSMRGPERSWSAHDSPSPSPSRDRPHHAWPQMNACPLQYHSDHSILNQRERATTLRPAQPTRSLPNRTLQRSRRHHRPVLYPPSSPSTALISVPAHLHLLP